MKNEKIAIEIIKTPEIVAKEPVAEVLGRFSELSRGKFGGSDLSVTKRKQ